MIKPQVTSETTGVLQARHIWNSVSGWNSQRIWGRFVIWCHETSSFVRTSAEIQVASTVVWTELLWRSWIHGRFMRIILETYIIWIKVPKIPSHKLSHFFKSQKRFFCLSNLHRFRLRFSSYHQAAPGCRGQFSPRWKTGRRALVLERRCSGSTKQCEGFWEFQLFMFGNCPENGHCFTNPTSITGYY